MGHTIVSGNKPSSVALHQNRAISQKPNWGGAEDPTINNFFQIEIYDCTDHGTI